MGIYTISNFLGKGISFLLIPLFTNPKFLTPEDNGLLSLFSQSLIFLIPFISMGVLQSASVDFFKLEKKDYKDFVTTGFFMSIGVTVFTILIFFIFQNSLTVKYHFPPVFIFLIPLVTFFIFCTEMLLSILRNNNEAVNYLVFNSVKIVIELGLAVLLICFYKWGWYGRVAGIFLAYLTIVLVAFRYFIKRGYLFGAIKKKYLKQELIYALPIILMQWSVFCTNSSDNFFLTNKHNGDTHVVGIYATACTFASIIIIICTALMQYLMPRIYLILSLPVTDYRSIKKIFIFYLAVMTAGAAFLLITIPFFYKLFINPVYYSSLNYYYYLVIGYYFWTISYFFYSFLLYYKQKKKILLLSVCNIAISLTLYYFFTKYWDVNGTAASVCTSFSVILVLTIIFNYKNVKLIFTKRIRNEENNL
ncbi:lipopolysaccharide biosynthesis protein [Ferruginibacter sp.]